MCRLADDDDVYDDDDDVYYYIRWRLKLEGETENMGVCTKERKGVTAAVLMATLKQGVSQDIDTCLILMVSAINA